MSLKNSAIQIFGAATAAPATLAKSTTQSVSLVRPVKTSLLPGVVAAGVGYWHFKKHPLLGALGGYTVGSNVYDLWKGDRTEALGSVGVAGAGIAGSLYWKKHPFLGWLAGSLAGSAVASLVPGTLQSKLKDLP